MISCGKEYYEDTEQKSIAFLMAIVMIFTFANFGTLSAFANDDEPIENTETISEDSAESDSEEQPVEELVSEIPELVSEPGIPDDPTENGSLGDISSGEVDLSQGGDVADLNSLDQPGTYEPIGSGEESLPDGVYSLKNVGNINYWASILNASDDANGYAVQTYYADNPMDSFNRACLFKISRIPNTNRYVIRLMLNNRLGLSLVGNAVRTKELPTNDADVAISDTFEIVKNNSLGFTIKPYNSDYVITAPNSTSSGKSNAKLHKQTAANAGNRCIWEFYKYTGEPLLGIPLDFSPNDWSYGATLNTEYTVELKPWSTTIGANTPYVTLHPDSVGAATEERIYDYTIKVTPTKVGPITIRAQIYVDGTTTTHTSYRCDFITVPDFDGDEVYIANNSTSKYIEIEGESTTSGGIIQQGDFHGLEKSKWRLEIEWWGYFSIISLYSNLRIGVNPSNTLSVIQTTEQTAYTDWMFTETSSGNYSLKCKAVDNKVLAVPSSNSGNGAYLTMITYTDNNDFCDEWNKYKISNSGAFLLGITDDGHDHSTALGAIMSDISVLGYTEFNCIVTNSITLSEVQNHMRNSQIYVSRSHGRADENGSYIGLAHSNGVATAWIHSNDIYDFVTDTVVVDLSNCDLMLFVACETGTSDSRSLPHAAVKAGADCAIGFGTEIGCDSANNWLKLFFKYYIKDDYTVQRAVAEATEDCQGSNGLDSVIVVSSNN